jgi:hypothetical protein
MLGSELLGCACCVFGGVCLRDLDVKVAIIKVDRVVAKYTNKIYIALSCGTKKKRGANSLLLALRE